MIKFKTVTAKNFLSIGNATQAISFCENPLTLVVGNNMDITGNGFDTKNSVGKTSLLNALSFALYGQALSNIKKDNLINIINKKNMLVTVELEKDGVEYRIERGRKPAVLKLFINGVDQNIPENEANDSQGDSRETQKDIENLMGMSHEMFKHLVALNTYTEPFLSTRANDQRIIIEQLLGITVLSEKAENLKNNIKITKDEIFRENAKIEAIRKSNDKIQESIESLRLRQDAWIKQRDKDIIALHNSIQDLAKIDIEEELAQHDKLKVYDELANKISSLNKQKATIESASKQAEKAVTRYTQEYETLSNNRCPACEQEIHDHKHETMVEDCIKHLQEAVAYADKLKQDLSLVKQQLTDIGDINGRPKTIYKTLNEAYNHRSNLEKLESSLQSRANETDTYEEQISELCSTALQDLDWSAVNDLTRLKDHQEFLLNLLTKKDSFIRKKIIDQNLAYLNNRLTYYLDKLGLPHTVTFQNDLSVEITQLGQDLDFHNLSRGEMSRLILSLSFSFRDVWESLYQGINLLFIDELIDNGLDASGVENTLSVLKSMSRNNKNVFLISHKEELTGRVNTVLKVTKENGFSTYAIESNGRPDIE